MGFIIDKTIFYICLLAGALIIDLLDHRDAVRCLDFTRDGTLQLLSASHDGSLKLWDLPNEGNLYNTFKSPASKSFCGCCFSPNGHFIAAVGSCKMVCIYCDNYIVTCGTLQMKDGLMLINISLQC